MTSTHKQAHMAARRVPQGTLLIWTLLLHALPVTSAAQAASDLSKKVANEIAAIDVQLQTLEADYTKALDQQAARPFIDRVEDARALLALGEQEKAALLLKALLQEPEAANSSYLADMHAWLAEALLPLGNYSGVKHHWQKAADQNPTAYLATAVRRLMQIVNKTNGWRDLEPWVNRLAQSSTGLPPDVTYLHGKALMEQGRPTDVLRVAGQVPPDHPFHMKAKYLSGVAYLLLDRLEDALSVFQQLREIPSPFKYDGGAQLQELATMNTARLLMEMRSFEVSAAAYGTIRKTSRHFNESLYERAWAFVRAAHDSDDIEAKRAQWNKATDTLSTFMLAEKRDTDAADAQILYANILLRSGKHDEAILAFSEVVEKYTPIRDRIDELIDDLDSPGEFLDELLNPSARRAGMLPSVAAEWAVGREDIVEALMLLLSLDETELTLYQASAQLIETLQEIGRDKRLAPSLEGPYALLMEIDNRQSDMIDRIITEERTLVAAELDRSTREQLNENLARRQKISADYHGLPYTRDEYEALLASTRERLRALRREALTLKIPLDQQRKSLDEMKKRLADHTDSVPPERMEEVREILVQQEAAVGNQTQNLTLIEKEITREEKSLSVVRAESARDEEVRKAFKASLEQEHQLLASVFQNSANRSALQALEEQRLRLQSQQDRVADMKAQFTSLGDRRVAEAKQVLAEIQEDINGYARTLQQMRDTTSAALADISQESLQQLKSLFSGIVLQGDVGIVDVAWARKEAQTDRINQRVQEQRLELQEFDRGFYEVVGDND